jgi:hypothetical protein
MTSMQFSLHELHCNDVMTSMQFSLHELLKCGKMKTMMMVKILVDGSRKKYMIWYKEDQYKRAQDLEM